MVSRDGVGAFRGLGSYARASLEGRLRQPRIPEKVYRTIEPAPKPKPIAKEPDEVPPPPQQLPEPVPTTIPTLKEILQAVCREWHVSEIDVRSARRLDSIIIPRHAAMVIMRLITERSTPQIGKVMGDRDHTSVLHALRKYSWLVAQLRAEVPSNAPLAVWASRAHQLIEARK